MALSGVALRNSCSTESPPSSRRGVGNGLGSADPRRSSVYVPFRPQYADRASPTGRLLIRRGIRHRHCVPHVHREAARRDAPLQGVLDAHPRKPVRSCNGGRLLVERLSVRFASRIDAQDAQGHDLLVVRGWAEGRPQASENPPLRGSSGGVEPRAALLPCRNERGRTRTSRESLLRRTTSSRTSRQGSSPSAPLTTRFPGHGFLTPTSTAPTCSRG
jgi:hypothetical protein